VLGNVYLARNDWFSVVVPTLWNMLPVDIRNASSLENVQSLLKTNLYKVAFTDK